LANQQKEGRKENLEMQRFGQWVQDRLPFSVVWRPVSVREGERQVDMIAKIALLLLISVVIVSLAVSFDLNTGGLIRDRALLMTAVFCLTVWTFFRSRGEQIRLFNKILMWIAAMFMVVGWIGVLLILLVH